MSPLLSRKILPAVLVLAALGAGGCRRRQAVPRNLLVVTLDTTRADSVGAYGNRDAGTPNLDRLAREGVLFRNAYTAVPLTLPAHATLFTGRYPTAHGVRNNGTYFLPPAELTLAELLAGNGFDNAAFIASFTLLGKFGLNQGFALYDEGFRQKQLALNFRDEAPAEEISGRFLAWLERRRGGRFFAWLHFYDPHLPYQNHREVDPRFAASERLRYQGEVAYVDLHLGRVLERLRAKRLLERTLVVVAGDHGEAFGEHGEFGHGIFCYEESLRVPLILRFPAAIARGRQVDDRVNLADVMPSILQYLNIPCPASVQGRSFHGPAAGRREKRQRDVYFESRFGLEANNWAPITGLIAGKHKYVSLLEPELYDLASDPGERRNLYRRQNRLARQLDGSLRRFLVDHAAAAVAGRRRLSVDDAASLKTLGYIAPAAAVAQEWVDPKRGLALYARLEGLKEMAKAGRLREAQAGLDAARADHPGAVLPGLFELEFMLHKGGGRMDAALAALGKGRAAFPGLELFLMTLANELAARGDSARAAALCREALAANPRLAAALVLLGDLARREGDADAAGFYRRALELEPQNARLQEALANLAAQAPEAERLDGLVGKARALVAGQRLDEARPLLEEALRRSPQHAEAWLQLGIIAARRGETAAARRHFQEAVRLDGQNALAHCNLGIAHWALFRQDGGRARLREALASFDRALALDPKLAAAYDGRGAARMELGENERAAEDFARLVELTPAAVDAHFNLAYALANAGRKGEALAALSRLRASRYAELGPRERQELDALVADLSR